jgi:hypothetical protein
MSANDSPQDLPDDSITERIIGAAIEVHRVLGPGVRPDFRTASGWYSSHPVI